MGVPGVLIGVFGGFSLSVRSQTPHYSRAYGVLQSHRTCIEFLTFRDNPHRNLYAMITTIYQWAMGYTPIIGVE